MVVPISVFTQRQILLFWLPLAASWALMSAEGPVLQAVIARLPDMQTQLAAFGIVMSLEITIESPVIMLLATSTALATSAGNYLTLRRFVVWINVLVTVVAFLAAFTPLYDLIVVTFMGIPTPIAEAARPGMKIMTLWSAAIGVRRFQQGILIRHGRTRWVGYGTGLRLASSAGLGIALALLTSLTGVQIASIALMAGVLAEMGYIAWAVRPTIRGLLAGAGDDSAQPVTFWEVTRFHSPLAAATLLTLLAQPVIGAGLARMPSPEENLAAWPVIWGILFIFRSTAFALPEAVIALVSEPRLRDSVRVFCHRVGWASSAALALLAVTPLLGAYLRVVAGLPDHLSRFVAPGLILTIPLPWINSIHSWFRGCLMAARETGAIYRGMGLHLALTTVLVLAGVFLQSPGAPSAVVAMTVSFLIEIEYLRRKLEPEPVKAVEPPDPAE